MRSVVVVQIVTGIVRPWWSNVPAPLCSERTAIGVIPASGLSIRYSIVVAPAARRSAVNRSAPIGVR